MCYSQSYWIKPTSKMITVKTLQKTLIIVVSCSLLVSCVLVLWSKTFTKTVMTALFAGHSFHGDARHMSGLNNVTRSFKLLHNMSYMTKYIGNDILPVTANDNSKYLIENPVLCDVGAELSFLLIVHTATSHQDRRQFIRDTWMNKANLPYNITARVLFLLGTTNQTSVQKRIIQESSQYGDILQGDFVDTYHNLTHKGVMAYRWISQRCQNAKYIVKIDDDTIINVKQLIELALPSIEGKRKTIICEVLRHNTIIRRKHKWHVEKSLFPAHRVYPPYCNGHVVIITNDLPPVLYEAAKTTPFFWVDDVYLYGLLPNRVPGFNFMSLRNNCVGTGCVISSRNSRHGQIKCNYTVVSDLDMSTLTEQWKRVQKSY